MKRILSLQEARSLLPIIRKVTEDSQARVNVLIRQLDSLQSIEVDRKKILEKEINELVENWQSKVEKLGGEPKGLWLVDFDCGVGYFCWKFPENDLIHFHGYSEGFKSRVKVDENFDQTHGEIPRPPAQAQKTPAKSHAKSDDMPLS